MTTPDGGLAATSPSDRRSHGWRRWRQPALEGLLLIVAGGALLTGILGTLTTMTDSPLPVPATLEGEPVVLAEDGGSRVEVSDVELTISDPSIGERLLAAAPIVLASLTIGAVATLLLEVVRSIREGDPFHRANARLLTAAALVALVGGTIASAVGWIVSATLTSSAPESFGLDTSAELSFLPLAVGIVLAAVADVFRRGTDLRDEVEGLV